MNDAWRKNIILFLTSQTISLFGSSLVHYALLWYITLHTKSGLMITIYIISGFLPSFFLSPFAGVWADRYNRKLLIIWADLFIATMTLIIALLFLFGHGANWLLFALSIFWSIGSGIQMPAVTALVPQIVPLGHLTKVNGINSSIQSTVMLVSPVLSGALLGVASIEAIFFIDVVTALIANVILIFFLRVPVHKKAGAPQEAGYFKDMHDGMRYIMQHAYIRRFFIFFAVFLFLVAPVAFLTPLQVTRSFGSEIWRLTAVEITFSFGMILGGMLLAGWRGFRNRIYTMTLANIMVGISTFLMGLVPYFWIYLSLMVMAGITMPLFNTPATVLIQEKVETDYQGRIFGVMGMISNSMMPLGMLIFGPVADYVQIEWLLIVTGIMIFLQSFFLIGSKEMVLAGRQHEAGIDQQDN